MLEFLYELKFIHQILVFDINKALECVIISVCFIDIIKTEYNVLNCLSYIIYFNNKGGVKPNNVKFYFNFFYKI